MNLELSDLFTVTADFETTQNAKPSMKVGDRNLQVRRLHQKVIPFAKILLGIRHLEKPIQYISCYLRRESPDQIRFKDGLRINFSSNPHDIVSVAVVFLQKDYGTVDRQSVVMDIGANIGTFALFAAQCGASKVFAFEPNKEAYGVLCKNIKDNNFDDVIHPFNCAISDSIGQVCIPRNSSPYNKIVEQGNDTETAPTDYDMVAADTVGNFMHKHSINHIDLIKMDCEGAEFSILPSLSDDTWTRISKIRMEYHRDPEPLIDLSHMNNFNIDRLKRRTKTKGDMWLTNGAT